jgi:hypothetical protein
MFDFDLLDNKNEENIQEKSGPSLAGGLLKINSQLKKNPNEE